MPACTRVASRRLLANMLKKISRSLSEVSTINQNPFIQWIMIIVFLVHCNKYSLISDPPKIAGFSFPMDLVEGSSVQVLCGITSGDKPVYFSWLKDGQHIPTGLGVQEKSLNEFSFLIFSHVTSKHSGEYTCVASNSAAEVNHTARLAVKGTFNFDFDFSADCLFDFV